MDIVLYKTVKDIGVSQKYVVNAISKTLVTLKKKGSVSISIIGQQKMRTINREYRNIDYVTDVLSFPINTNDFFGSVIDKTYVEFGDIFICPYQIKKQAKQFGITYKEEFTRMLVHGVLHLLGYDHIKKKDADNMFPLQEKIVSSIMKNM